MDALDADDYFIHDVRLNSFQKTIKKRGSANGGRSAKVLSWPHKEISPAKLAQAGFFFRPSPESADNTVCFLCEKGLDGWENGDDPLLEHLKHSPDCGWAVVAAIEAEIGDYYEQDPNSPDMIEARTATFAERWPHDTKKGWKCKTKQLVEAGWIYTPTDISADMTTCAYCQLGLDGWERNDKPYDEHFIRSPSCPFFSLLEQYKGTSKTTGRAKSSRAARASSQSVTSDTTTMMDQTSGLEDSVLVTGNGTKKPKVKRAAAVKGAKKTAKKDEPSDILEENLQTGDETSQSQPPFQPKAKRGKKRGSEVVNESTVNTTNEPAPKKRTRTPISTAENSSLTDSAEATDAAAPIAGRSRKIHSSTLNPAHRSPVQQAPPSSPSVASPKAPPGNFPDDDEIERQLDEDLARQLSETDIAPDSDSERSRVKVKVLAEKAPEEPTAPAQKTSASYAMFDPNAPDPDEKMIDDELKMLQAEMEVDEPEQSRHTLHKFPKAATRKVSAKSAAYSEEGLDSAAEVDMQSEGQVQDDDDDMTVGSTETVLKKAYRKNTATNSGRGRGRPLTASLVSTASQDEEVDEQRLEPPTKRGRGRPSKASLASQSSSKGEDPQASEAPPKKARGRPSKSSLASQDRDSVIVSTYSAKESEPPKRGRGRPSKKSLEKKAEAAAEEAELDESQPTEKLEAQNLASIRTAQDGSSPRSGSPSLQAPSTPAKTISPAPSAKQPNLSPSQTPQSSDAENQPPLARSAAAAAKRVALAPVAATPSRASPSKRNVLAGLQSTTPWTAANVEAIFGTPHAGKSTENSVEQFLKRGRELSTPEKQMTVEEWIYYNANEAENKLKHECETLVSRFENEGTRAINVLEGLEVE